jgi:type IV pilus assembly protein PilF
MSKVYLPSKWMVCVWLSLFWIAGCTTVVEVEVPQENRARAAELNAQLGIAYMNEGQMDVARVKLEKALDQNPGSPLVHSGLAVYNEKLKDFELAEQHLRKALDLADAQGSGGAESNNLARFLCSRKRYDEAAVYFDRAVNDKHYQNKELVYTNAGRCLIDQGRDEEAAEMLRKTLQVNRTNSAALFAMAGISYRQKVLPLAKNYIDRYHALVSPSAETLWLAYRIERALGSQTDVLRYSTLLKRDFPDSEETAKLFMLEAAGTPQPSHKDK